MAQRRRRGEGSITQRKDGRWHGRIDMGRGLHGKRSIKHVYANTQAELVRTMRPIAAQVGEGASVPTATPTLARFLNDWFASNEERWRPSTRRSYRGAIDNLLVPALGTVRLEKLSPLIIQRWVDQHKTEHGARRRVELARAVLRSALADAERLQVVSANAAGLVRLPTLKKRPIEPLSVDEASRFVAEASKHRLGALFTVALACGLRLGEALGLSWDDIDFTTGVVSVNQQLQAVGKRLELQPLKTVKCRRKVMLPEFAKAALESHRAKQRVELFAAGPDSAHSGLVFTTYAREGDGRQLGTPQHPRNVTRVFYRVLENGGLRQIRFHDLRHSAASLLISQGVQLVEVSKLLGHSELRVTADLYSHLQQQTAARAAQHMDALLNVKAS
jgi:integrase